MWKQLPGVTKWAFAAATALAAVYAVGFLWDPLAALVCEVVYLLVARGLWRGRAWAGYGGALFQVASAVAIPIARRGAAPVTPAVAGAIALSFAIGLLFYFGGRALARREQRGLKAGWIALAAVTLLLPLIAQPFVFPSASMSDTILAGDRFLVQRVAFGEPSRGDLVVFRYPPDPGKTFVMRVVAMGGDRLRIVDKKVILNGRELPEPYAVHKSDYVDAFRDSFPQTPNLSLPGNWAEQLPRHVIDGELVVPPGSYFVLGDNRDNALDSRYWGFLTCDDIVGEPLFVYFSADAHSIRWNRLFHAL